MLFVGDVGRGRRTINGPFGAVIKLDVMYHLDTSSSGSNSLNRRSLFIKNVPEGSAGQRQTRPGIAGSGFYLIHSVTLKVGSLGAVALLNQTVER